MTHEELHIAGATIVVPYVEGEAWLCPAHAPANHHHRAAPPKHWPCDRCVAIAHQTALLRGSGWSEVEAAVRAAGYGW